MEIKEQIVLSGSMDEVLRDAARLQEFLKSLSTFGQDGDAARDNWPHYENGALTYAGSVVSISEKQYWVLRPLLEARGTVVRRDELVQAFVADGSRPNQLNVVVSRLRNQLNSSFDGQLSVETIGEGLRLVVA